MSFINMAQPRMQYTYAAIAIGGGVLIAGGIGAGTAAAASGKYKDTMRRVDKLVEVNPNYTSSPYAQNNLGYSQMLLNSRMAGAANRQNNILSSGANVRSGIQRNATDSSQALSLMAGTQGQSDQSFNDLQMQEAQDAMQKQNNLFTANRDMSEDRKDVFDDSVRRWQDQLSALKYKRELRQQRSQGWANLGGMLTGAGTSLLGMSGGKK